MSEKLYRYDLFVATHDDECIRMILDAPSREQACRAIIHGFHGVGVRYIDNYYPLDPCNMLVWGMMVILGSNAGD
jgi:hypothetical protein